MRRKLRSRPAPKCVLRIKLHAQSVLGAGYHTLAASTSSNFLELLQKRCRLICLPVNPIRLLCLVLGSWLSQSDGERHPGAASLRIKTSIRHRLCQSVDRAIVRHMASTWRELPLVRFQGKKREANRAHIGPLRRCPDVMSVLRTEYEVQSGRYSCCLVK